MTGESQQVFLPHPGADKSAGEELAQRLQKAGIESWQEAIETALARCSPSAGFIGPSGRRA